MLVVGCPEGDLEEQEREKWWKTHFGWMVEGRKSPRLNDSYPTRISGGEGNGQVNASSLEGQAELQVIVKNELNIKSLSGIANLSTTTTDCRGEPQVVGDWSPDRRLARLELSCGCHAEGYT